MSPFFFPEKISTGRYNTVLVQELVDRGCTTQVLASHPLYPEWKPQRTTSQLPGVRVTRGGGWLRFPARPLGRRLLLELWFASFTVLEILRARPDASTVVVMVFPPNLYSLLCGAVLPRKCPRVGIVHDLQGALASNVGSRRARPLLGLVRHVERRALAACDRLVFLSRSMAEKAIAEYAIPRIKCVVQYPFLTLPATSRTPTDALSRLMPPGRIHVVYAGALGDKQDPDRLVGLMRRLCLGKPDLDCHVFSAGPHFQRLAARNDDLKGRLLFHPLVPDEVLEELHLRSTVQLLPQATGTADAAMPSKLPNLLAAGVPVFAICQRGSEVVQMIESAGPLAGDFAEDFDAPDLQGKLFAFLDRVRGEPRQSRAERQRPLVEKLAGVAAVAHVILDVGGLDRLRGTG